MKVTDHTLRRTSRLSYQQSFMGLCLLAMGLSGMPAWGADPLEMEALPEFEVIEFAGDDLAHDIFSMTIDSLGRVVVSGPGYVKILVDQDKDGVADKAIPFADGPATGAQGLYFFGRDLLCAGDGGLLRYRDRNFDDRADGPPDVFLKIKAGSEHDLHAIRKGPDGWWYLIAGNGAGVDAGFATLPSSPIKKPHAGAILRLKPDLSQGEVLAHGIRNAYDFDFAQGELFTCDSDGEQELSLPWYLPARLFHVLPGSHLGWITNDCKRPDYYFDMPPVTASLGRGSPTGMVCYQHTAFPKEFHGALFVLDWAYGRIYALPLKRSISTWSSRPIEFLKSVGQSGFAPTDVEVGPQGELYVSVGGRGTRGAVYCIRPRKPNPESRPWPGGSGIASTPAAKLDLCLRAPQPLSSWSRRVWEPVAKDLTAEPFIKAGLDPARQTAERIRAIEILTEKFHGLDGDMAAQLATDADPLVRARAAWSLGRMQSLAPNVRTLEPFLRDPDPLAARHALEALSGAEPAVFDGLVDAIGRLLAHPDRYLRQSAMRLLQRTRDTTVHEMARVGFPLNWRAAIPVAAAYAFENPGNAAYTVDVALSILEANHPDILKLEAVRLLELGLGDLAPPADQLPPVFDGYASPVDLTHVQGQVARIHESLGKLYPTGRDALDCEIERVMAMLQFPDGELLDQILSRVTAQSDPMDDLHRLIVAARLPVSRTAVQQKIIAETLIHLEAKIIARQMRQDSGWDDRVMELYEALVALDPKLPVAIIVHPEFGRPGHVRFVVGVQPDLFKKATAAFARQIQADPDYLWTPEVVYLLGASDDHADRDRIREKFDDFSLRSAVVAMLSVEPEEKDRRLFIRGLESSTIETMLQCIGALNLLPPSGDAEENVVLVRALRRLGDQSEERQARDQIVEALRRNLHVRDTYVLGREGDSQSEAVTAWVNHVRTLFPDEFSRQSGQQEENLAELKQRLTAIPWERGDVHHGQQLFGTRGCAQCHGQRKALGPDLSGATGRFSREDLFTAIVFPDRDVSPRFQTLQIATRDGHVRVGMIVYEGVDGLVVRDANNHTYRIDSDQIEQRRPIPQSMMPAGLLKGLNDQDLADLYAYLQTLGLKSTAAAESNKSPE
jgi:putative membrane-bound dehydrogenase-like protein